MTARSLAKELTVPYSMQVSASTKCANLELIATLVASRSGMQRLVDIPNEVNDVLECDQAHSVWSRRLQDSHLLGDSLDHASVVFAVKLAGVDAASIGDVDVVQGRGSRPPALIGPG